MKINGWKFKDGIEINLDEFWYDLTLGGYIKPEEILQDEKQIARLNKAIEIVLSFEQSLELIMEEQIEGDE